MHGAGSERGWRLAAKRAALTILSVALVLLLSEGICAVLDLTGRLDADFKFFVRQVDNDLENVWNREDPLLMWSLQPGYADENVRVNQDGFRDRVYPMKKASGVVRILCVGDSCTFGHRVGLESVYHSVLERRLNEERPGGVSYECINAGVTGYSTAQMLRFLRQRGIHWRPDIVTVYPAGNDGATRFELTDRQVMDGGMSPRLANSSVVNALVRLRTLRVLRAVLRRRQVSTEGSAVKTARVPLVDTARNLREMVRVCRSVGAVPVFIRPPISKSRLASNDSDYVTTYFEYREVLDTVAAELAVPYVRVDGMQEDSAGDTTALFIDSFHPTPAGHRLVADALYNTLRDASLLPPPAQR